MPASENDLALDKRLSQLCALVPLLSLVTPTNVAEEKEKFLATGIEPDFEYRELPNLDELGDELSELRSEDADDPAIANMSQGVINELGLRLEMFRNRGTESFFLTAVEMFGHVDQPTLDLARNLIHRLPEQVAPARSIDADAFAERARTELEHYRTDFPEMTSEVKVSGDISGVLVETGDLYVSRNTRVSEQRVDPLLQHEVGTHLVTYLNGRAQPLQLLSLGLAGYDELQEALGVLAEHFAGGVPPSRMRTLAYRVIAANARSEGADFTECFNTLVGQGCSPNSAFITTMRAYRSGGMTKDAIYLRGLARLLDHLGTGAKLEPLFIGKISFETIPLINELRQRGSLGRTTPATTVSRNARSHRNLERACRRHERRSDGRNRSMRIGFVRQRSRHRTAPIHDKQAGNVLRQPGPRDVGDGCGRSGSECRG